MLILNEVAATGEACSGWRQARDAYAVICMYERKRDKQLCILSLILPRFCLNEFWSAI